METRKYYSSIGVAAKALRKGMTKPEALLWSELRNRRLGGLKFRRQVPFDTYILDFLCPLCKLIIEVDGGSHIGFDERDTERDTHFQSLGYTTLRFSNERIRGDLPQVLEEIARKCNSPHPPAPSPSAGEGE
jgi:leucyl-tRNA synthetase